MNIMTKRGALDNNVTYEHYCDTKADLANIPQDQISLGSVAIVLKDEDDSMGIYLANSNKEWISFSISGGGSSMSDISLANLVDVSLANPNNGDTLVYDATSKKWVAQASSSSGGDNIMIVNLDHSSEELITYEGEPATSYLCDKTPSQIFNHLQNGGVAYFKMHIINDSIYQSSIDYVEYYIEDNTNYYYFRSTNTQISNSPSATIVQTILVYNSEFSEERVVWQTKSK